MNLNLPSKACSAFAALCLAASSASAQYGLYPEPGDIAPDFTVLNRATGKLIHRGDYAGKILILDFFDPRDTWYWDWDWDRGSAYQSTLLQSDIYNYYRLQGGNPFGVKVEILGVNTSQSLTDRVDDFINYVGFKTVADDFGRASGAWYQFFNGTAFPHYVIINGVRGGNMAQWEVLHNSYGFDSVAYYRSLIDAVKPPMAPKIAVFQPKGTALKTGVSKISFGTRTVKGTTISKTFIIRNKGNVRLRNISVTNKGSQAADFLITNPAVVSLAPGARTTFKVTFKPSAIGTRTATLLINSNDKTKNPFTVGLTGTGVAN